MKTHSFSGSRTMTVSSGKQGGAVLILSLIILIMLTMLVVSSLKTSVLDERIAGNARDQSLAFQSVEAVLRAANTDLIGKSIWDFNDACAGGLCSQGNAPTPGEYDWSAGTKHVAIDKSLSTATVSAELADNPGYFAEYAGMIKSSKCPGGWCPVYRVSGTATGKSEVTRVIIQEVERQH